MGRFYMRRTWIRQVTKTILALAIATGLAGVACRLFVFDLTVDRSTLVSQREVPLSGINGIDVDSSGRIYVGTEDYGRIQVYAGDGRFLYGVSVGAPTASGAFRFRVIDGDVIEVYGFRTDALTRYTSAGISTTRYRVTDSPIPGPTHVAGPDGEGRMYRVAERSWLWPRVLRSSGNGSDETAVSQSALLWLLKIPVPSLVFLIASFLVIRLFHGRGSVQRAR